MANHTIISTPTGVHLLRAINALCELSTLYADLPLGNITIWRNDQTPTLWVVLPDLPHPALAKITAHLDSIHATYTTERTGDIIRIRTTITADDVPVTFEAWDLDHIHPTAPDWTPPTEPLALADLPRKPLSGILTFPRGPRAAYTVRLTDEAIDKSLARVARALDLPDVTSYAGPTVDGMQPHGALHAYGQLISHALDALPPITEYPDLTVPPKAPGQHRAARNQPRRKKRRRR